MTDLKQSQVYVYLRLLKDSEVNQSTCFCPPCFQRSLHTLSDFSLRGSLFLSCLYVAWSQRPPPNPTLVDLCTTLKLRFRLRRPRVCHSAVLRREARHSKRYSRSTKSCFPEQHLQRSPFARLLSRRVARSVSHFPINTRVPHDIDSLKQEYW